MKGTVDQSILSRAGRLADRHAMFWIRGPDMVPTEGPASDQPGGPGTPWAGVAAGWHAMMDTLEKLFNKSTPDASLDALCGFYRGYLDDVYRWRSMVQPTDRVDKRVPA